MHFYKKKKINQNTYTMKKFTLIKMFAIALVLFANVNFLFAQYGGAGTFTKVTSLTDLEDGAYYVLYGINGSYEGALSNSISGGRFGATSVTVSSDEISDPDASVVWRLDANGSNWNLYNEASSKYCEITTNSTSGFSANSSASSSYTVSVSSGDFAFMDATIARGISLYQTDFRPYAASSMKTLYLYKMGTSSPSTPLITLSTSALSGFKYIVGSGPSTSQSFDVSGSNLTSDITVTPSTNYELSTDNSNFQSTVVTLTQSGGTVSSTLYVRLKAGLSANTYDETITATSTDATNKDLNCSGKVLPVPAIPFLEDFTSDADYFDTFSSQGDQAWGWANYDGGCMSMSGHVSTPSADYDNTDWLISPTFDLTGHTGMYMNFREAINYITSYNELQVMISTNYSGSVAGAGWTELTVTGRPAGNSWDFIDVGPVDLSAYDNNSSVTIAFKYTSTTGGSSTWEISQISVNDTEPLPTVLPNAWVNEIHYDNEGTDVNEMVEVVIERADTMDLSDFSVNLYRSDGTIYDTRSLGDFTTGNVDGTYSFFYLIYPVNGLQNGTSGISLDWKGALIQFLSYEGTVTGTEGPADGILSTDIGVSESSSKLAGQSLQLEGVGLQYSHFSWVDPVATPGAININQTLASPPPPVPVDWKYVLLSFILIASFIVYRKLR